MENSNQPLVSVLVVTYNSSKTVLETLDSIYNQIYQNLELIVSDDCSTDNTVAICRDWIETHKERFVRTVLLTSEKNTGVSANMNRGADACEGEWVKDIAGDDVLLPNCIEIYVDYVKEHPKAVYVFAKVEVFGGDEEERRHLEHFYSIEQDFFIWSNEKQYDFLTLEGNHIPAATAFYNREKVISKSIRNDERIPFQEDKPKWINCLKAGIRFDFINKITVRYRLSENSLWRHNEQFQKSQAKAYIYYCFNNDYKKRSKRKAILQRIRAKRIINNNAIFWRVLSKIYRIMGTSN